MKFWLLIFQAKSVDLWLNFFLV